MVDHLRGMKGKADRSGLVFDIEEKEAERFLEISQHLTETDSTIDFQIVKCLTLPELLDEESFNQWRGGSNGGGYHSSFSKHSRH